MGNDTNIKYNEIPQKIEKDWGYELIIHNDNGYCGKILHFNKYTSSSMHYHINKHETFYVNYGVLRLMSINPINGIYDGKVIRQGDIITIPQGQPHQLQATQESEIFEVSTPDDIKDSYRVWMGANES